MPRQAALHNKAALKGYVSRIRDLAKQLDTVADELGTRGEDCAVSLSYHRGLEKGLVAIKLLIGDVEKKMTQEKFSFGTSELQPTVPMKAKRKKGG